jgi:polysaccharide biosynthesis protein VpsQ
MKRIAFVFTFLIILIIILADIGALPPFIRAVYDFPFGDKIGHFVLFGLFNFILTLTGIRSLRHLDPKLVAVSIGLILAFFITMEEFSQLFISRRTFSFLDLLAGYLGIILGGWLAWRLKK